MPEQTTEKTHLRRSWLVQRLEKPRHGGGQFDALLSSMSFGGGLRNGGLTAEALSLLSSIFAFDYMGSAEFEWGAVPKALQGLAAKPKQLRAGSFNVPLAQVAGDWRERKGATPEGEATVYYLCRKGEVDEVECRARQWAAEGHRAQLKESTNLNSTLRPHNEWDGRTVGWLELDNGFFLFTDRAMWEQTCGLFGVRTPTGQPERS